MRKPVLNLCLLLIIGLLTSPMLAQEEQTMTVEQFIDMVREAVKKDRVALVGQGMGLTAEDNATFWPIYNEYEKEFTKIGDSRLELIKNYAANYMSMTDDKAKELAQKALDLETERTALKQRYFEKLSDAMSPVTAARFLQVENQLSMLLDLKIASQLPLIEKGE